MIRTSLHLLNKNPIVADLQTKIKIFQQLLLMMKGIHHQLVSIVMKISLIQTFRKFFPKFNEFSTLLSQARKNRGDTAVHQAVID